MLVLCYFKFSRSSTGRFKMLFLEFPSKAVYIYIFSTNKWHFSYEEHEKVDSPLELDSSMFLGE